MTSSLRLFCLFLVLFETPVPTEQSKILFLMPVGAKSHKNFFDGVVRALARVGHQVTMISGLNRTLDEPNVKNIILKEDNIEFLVGNTFNKSIFSLFGSFLEAGASPCLDALIEPSVQKAIREDHDLIITSMFMTECFMPSIYEKKVPFMYAMPVFPVMEYSSMMGNLDFPSIVPSLALETESPMTFLDRMKGAAGGVIMELFVQFFYDRRIESQCRSLGFWPEAFPSLFELKRKASMVISNSVKSLEVPARPISPSIIFAGGVHIEPPKTLPKDVEDWIESSGDEGFILFSLGSVTRTEFMKEEHRKIFVKVFSELKQKVLWKWDSEVMEDLPNNVKLSKWLPQTDILAHQKIRLFITHGGLLSTLETTHYGVPTLGMAVFADQKANIDKSYKEGRALKLEWKELTEDLLREKIQSALHDPRIKSNAVHFSKLMRDRPMTPAEEVVYWTEYVIRHEGATHLQCPFSSMSWFKIYNMDVWFTVAIVLLLLSTTFICSSVFCIQCCVRGCKSTGRSASKPPPKSRKGHRKTVKEE